MNIGPALEAAQRAARDELRPVAAAAEAAMFAAQGAQRLGSDSHPRDVARLSEDGFRAAMKQAASIYVGIKGRGARQKGNEFRDAMQPIIAGTLSILDQNDGTGTLFQKPLKVREQLEASLRAALEDTISDIAVGVFELPGQSHDGPTNIHFHGAATNIAIATDGSSLTMGEQTAQLGVTLDELLAALDQVEAAVATNATMPESEKDVASDVVVNARRELQLSAPDAGRLKRFFNAVGDISLKVGTSAAGGVIARLLSQLGGFG